MEKKRMENKYLVEEEANKIEGRIVTFQAST